MRSLILALLLIPCAAQAQVSLLVGGVSHHFDAGDVEYNERNPLLGLEYRFNRDWSVSAARYKNSHFVMSNAFTGAYTPLHFGDFHGGVMAGAVSGYVSGTSTQTVDGYEACAGTETYANKCTVTREEREGFRPLLAVTLEYRQPRYGVQLTFIPSTPKNAPTLMLGFKLSFDTLTL